MKVAAVHQTTTRLVLVLLRDCKTQTIKINHDKCLDEVPVDCITHPGTSSLNFDTAAPLRMISINLVAKGRLTVLAEEHRPLNLVNRRLALLDLEAKLNQVLSQNCQDLITS